LSKSFQENEITYIFIESHTMNFRLIIFALYGIIISFSVGAQNPISDDSTVIVRDGDTAVFRKVEFEATFPGGQTEWRRFLERSLRGDVATEHGAPAGSYTVVAQFIVDKEGNISEIKPLTNLGYGMEEEVVRILKKSPKWSPAILNGKPVKAYRRQPITFFIEEDNFQITTEEPFVLYAGTDNNVTIVAYKVKPGDLEVTISQGSIIPKGNGNYTVRVARPGRVIITLFDKKHKEIGAASFDVKQKDKPAVPQTLKG
jgi:hypothetical protein